MPFLWMDGWMDESLTYSLIHSLTQAKHTDRQTDRQTHTHTHTHVGRNFLLIFAFGVTKVAQNVTMTWGFPTTGMQNVK